jgi:hypothetical protein
MKHNNTPAVVDFKAQVDRMADYLQAAGYEVKRTHLMEASARFQGARDWRTLRAELENKPVKQTLAVPDLKGKTVRIYMDVQARSNHGEGPQFCWTDINQAWVNRVYELRALCAEKHVSEIDDDFDAPDWMDDFGTYRIQSDGITVTQSQFWFYGFPKHADYRVETSPFFIEKVIELAQRTTRNELYFFSDKYTVDSLMGELGRGKDHPEFVSSDDDDCVVDPNMI